MEDKTKIPLKNEKKEIIDHAIIDEKYFDKFINMKWYKKDSVAITHVDGKELSMQSFVIKGKEKKSNDMILHLNNNSLDNREENLTYGNHSQLYQNRNKVINANTTSNYKGVTKDGNKWRARYSSYSIGTYDEEIQAAMHYDTLVLYLFSGNGKTNDTVKYVDIINKEIPDDIMAIINKIKNKKNTINVKTDFDKSTDIARGENGKAQILVKKGDRYIETYVSDNKWHLINQFEDESRDYPYANIDGKKIRMHKFILYDDIIDANNELKYGIIIDHIDKNKHNCCTDNLRVVDNSANSHNRDSILGSSSQYKGVHLSKNNTWEARVKKDNKKYYLGKYKVEEQAALAYNIAAGVLHKDYVDKNKINDIEKQSYDDVLDKLKNLKVNDVLKL